MATIKPEVLDGVLAGVSSPDDLMGDAGLFKQLKKALMERALGAELTHHLGHEKGDPAGRGQRQQSQRPFRQDGADRGRRARSVGSARPGRDL